MRDGRGPRVASAHSVAPVDADEPVAGFYMTKLSKGAAFSAVRIWHGFSIDPATGEEVQERSSFWQCEINGQRVPLERAWPSCAREPIDAAEYERILARNLTLDEASAFYDVRQPIDIGTAPPPF